MSGPDSTDLAWLRLAALNETARRRNALLEQFGSPEALFAATDAEWDALAAEPGLRQRVRQAAGLDLSRELARLQELGIRLVQRGDDDYPPLLATIDDPPPVLFVRGRLPRLGQPCVALVGTRRCTAYGELVAEDLSRRLAEAGVAVVSGLASGIDAAAHRGALLAGGLTLAVLGTGVDVPYPAENRTLYDRLVDEGGVLSEFLPGTAPRAWHFPVRNRLLSGLSRAVVVVQAPSRSGALLTATSAAEQGREVMAVPGPITDASHTGCHDLIRDGAVLVRGVGDILEALRLPTVDEPPAAPAAPPPSLTPAERQVAEALGLTPTDIDRVIETTGLAAAEVQTALVTLELKQVVRRMPGNRFARTA